ncbi:MAG TPA: DUF4097 family beta strand repeat-containing protein [Thermomicrobiales bacterium]|nr:DUF4097 family beta strand repeat-containing protein [Thermomicrobiales bacterium]
MDSLDLRPRPPGSAPAELPPTAPPDDEIFTPAPPTPARGRDGRLVGPLILIALGLAFLVGNLWNYGGGLLFLGLGAAFLAARVLSGRYGFAVPAGILLGFGAFVALVEAGVLKEDVGTGGWFFVLLGLGFAAVYVIGWRPAAIWPFFPAAGLLVSGLLLLGSERLAFFARFAAIGRYWPLALVLGGLWLLARDRLPAEARRPLGIAGLVALAAYGVLAVAGLVAAASWPADLTFGPAGPLGAPITETVTLQGPLAAGQTLHISNTSGRTTVRAAAVHEVSVTATKHRWTRDQSLDVRLTPGADGLTLAADASPAAFLGNRPYADYVIEVPAAAAVDVDAASGDVEIRGVAGAVDAATASGAVTVADAAGPVTVKTASGAVRLSNVGGELRAETVSGDLRATGAAHPVTLKTISGTIDVAGTFAAGASISTVSGDVAVRFDPASATRIAVGTLSGGIRVQGLALADQRQDRRSLTGTLGGGTATLEIHTTSGAISLSSAP